MKVHNKANRHFLETNTTSMLTSVLLFFIILFMCCSFLFCLGGLIGLPHYGKHQMIWNQFEWGFLNYLFLNTHSGKCHGFLNHPRTCSKMQFCNKTLQEPVRRTSSPAFPKVGWKYAAVFGCDQNCSKLHYIHT